MIHPVGTFDECDFPSFSEVFACCDRIADGDQNIAFDCKSTLPGGGECNSEYGCIENYREGLAEVEAIANQPVEEEESSNALIIVTVCLVSIISIMVLAYVAYSTRCFKKRICNKKNAAKEQGSVKSDHVDSKFGTSRQNTMATLSRKSTKRSPLKRSKTTKSIVKKKTMTKSQIDRTMAGDDTVSSFEVHSPQKKSRP